MLFAAASAAGGLATDASVLIASRVIKGLCAALTAPTGLAIICATYREGAERNRSLSVYSMVGACGFTLGLLLSGLLTPLSWRWTFLAPAQAAAALFLAGLRFIPPDPVRPAGSGSTSPVRRCCWPRSRQRSTPSPVFPLPGWTGAPTLIGLAGTVALAVGFAIREASATQPLVRAGVLGNPALLRASLGAASLNGTYWALLLLMTYQLQTQASWSPPQVALAILPASVPLAVAAPFSARIVARWQPTRLVAAGAAAALAGGVWYAVFAPYGYRLGVLPALVFIGAGFVLAFAALHVQAASAVPDAEQPMASGIYQTAVQAGGAVMVALATALWARPDGLATPAEAGPRTLLFVAAGATGLVVALTGLRVHRGRAAEPARP